MPARLERCAFHELVECFIIDDGDSVRWCRADDDSFLEKAMPGSFVMRFETFGIGMIKAIKPQTGSSLRSFPRATNPS